MQDTVTEPKGIGFFNIKGGETHYAKLEPTIQAYINSSDMGINASRDQDFGWRLEPEWVQLVKEFRKDENKMERLVSRNGGQKVTVPQILYSIYGEQLRAYQQEVEEHESPFEEEYLQNISNKPKAAPVVAPPAALPTDVPDEVDEADLAPAQPTSSANPTNPANKPVGRPAKQK